MDNRFGWFVEDVRFKVSKDGQRPAIHQFNSGNGYAANCSCGFKDKDGNWSNLFVKVMVTSKTQTMMQLAPEMAFKCWGRVSFEETTGQDGRKWQNWTIWADRIDPIDQQPQRPQFDGGAPGGGMDNVPF